VRPLNSAAASGCLACVLSLLQYGAQPDGRQAGGWTALHSAAKHGNHEMAKALLASGADPQGTSDDGQTPLDLASESDSAMRQLLTGAAGAD